MTLFLRCFVGCLLLFGVGLPSIWAQVDVRTLKKGVVKIVAESGNDREVGTGFIAAKSKKHLFIVTASHVVEGKAVIQVTFFTHQEEAFPAKIVKMEGGDQRGLALLKVKGDLPEDVQILSWDTTTQVMGGEEVYLIGFPRVGGNDWAVTKGMLANVSGSVLKFTGAVAEGNSGGPLLYQGKVIGVVMEQGEFGNAKPAQIAKFTVEHWPGYPRRMVITDPSSEPSTHSIGVVSPSVAPQPGMATLVVQTTPTGAQVFVDDELVGQTNQGPVVVRNLEPDEYDVMVTKDGFRSWDRMVDLRSGDQRTLSATLQAGITPVVSGVWKSQSEPTISYVFQQQGNKVTMAEVTTSILGTVVTAQGEGQLQGNQLEIMYTTVLGTMGQSTTTLSEDGQQLVGTFQDFSNMIPVAISLMRTGESPSAFSPSGSADFNSIQNFGR